MSVSTTASSAPRTLQAAALYFNGRSSSGANVQLEARPDGGLRVHGAGCERQLSKADYRLLPIVGRAALRLRTGSGELLELPYREDLVEFFRGQASRLDLFLHLAERRWRIIVAAALSAAFVWWLIYACRVHGTFFGS